ncbi:MAG TPA: hypothetical protein DCZ94_09320 [Lentisphaeria bacterium]|nr:MAG: hypothetical protein A2X48_18325 [Lentisphaerae bacterium GWF2_49_21]HBC87140.1 hypothetical protein [Lentisphaeria bacterium]
MKIALIRFKQREGARSNIPWHFSFYKDILEPKGHHVDIIDDQVEDLGVDRMVGLCIDKAYDVIGAGGIGTTYNQLMEFSEKIKQRKKDIVIVAGGQIVADYEFIMQTCQIDIIVRGEGEMTLSKIIDALERNLPFDDVKGLVFRKNRELVVNPPEDLIRLDDLPDFNFNNIDISRYDTSVGDIYLIDETARKLKEKGDRYIGVFLARGCPYNCFFCYRHLKGYRAYTRERLEKILSGLKEKGFSFISYSDECVTANIKNLRNICEISKKYDIYWMTSGRADHLDDEVLKLLKENNCVGIQVGVESFDDRMLKAMNKGTSGQQNIDAMNLIYRYGLYTVLQLVNGAPGEDRKTILNTRKGMWKCYFKLDKIASAIMNPYPGSPAYYYGLEKGYIKDKGWIHRNFSSKGEIIVNFSDLSMRELKTWQIWLHLEAGLSFRMKNKAFLFNKSFLIRMKNFLSCYLKLLQEPINFAAFSYYLLLGFTYWLKPVKSPELQ